MNLLWIFFYLFRLAFKLGKLFISIKLNNRWRNIQSKVYGVEALSLRTTSTNYLTFIYLCVCVRIFRFFYSCHCGCCDCCHWNMHGDFDWKRNGKIFGWINCRCLTNTNSEINKLRKLLIKKLKQSMVWYAMAMCMPTKSFEY